MKYFRTFLTSLSPAVVLNYGTVLGSKETSLSLRREVRSFEILIPDAFVSRREGVCNKAFPDCAWQLLSNQRMDVPLSNQFI